MGTTATAAAFSEPSEPFAGQFAPENAMVDLIDNALRTGVAFGLAPQILRRIDGIADLARPPAPSGRLAEGVSEGASKEDLGTRIVLTSAIALLRDHAKRARHPATQDQHTAIADALAAMLPRAKTGSQTGAQS